MLTALVSEESCDKQVKRDVYAGKYEVVFFTPEVLIRSKRWRKVLTDDTYQQYLEGLVIDEAHRVKKW
jgi:ATP-dependent DNA helicase RecQ